MPCDRQNTQAIIYIPPCIYFNFHYRYSITPQILFTFHYVSISTGIALFISATIQYLHSTMYLFQLECKIEELTREVIYIPLCIYFNFSKVGSLVRINSHLHSTMYLFQPSYHNRSYRFDKIYIPLCIYFNNV